MPSPRRREKIGETNLECLANRILDIAYRDASYRYLGWSGKIEYQIEAPHLMPEEAFVHRLENRP
jgi:hypothetical protein